MKQFFHSPVSNQLFSYTKTEAKSLSSNEQPVQLFLKANIGAVDRPPHHCV
jgi:hypothetical protein